MKNQFKLTLGLVLLFFTCTFPISLAYQTVTDSVNKIVFQGPNGSGFGNQVVSGDFNGDGIKDIIIVSKIRFQDQPLIISLFYGSSSIDTTADLVITADTIYSDYSYSIANAGDVNNDGFDDLIVSFSNANNYFGKVLLYFGGNPMDANCDLVLNGERQYSSYGTTVSTAGDINGDGYSDFLVGSSHDWYFQTDTAKVFLYLGNSNLDTIPDFVFYSQYFDDYFGSSISSIGDVNGDGFDDIIIGSKWYYDKVFVFFGGENFDTNADLVLQNFQWDSRFGYSIYGDIDLNQDGFDDIIIGAPNYKIGNDYQQGQVYVYNGGDPMDITPDLVLNGQDSHGHLGFEVSGAGYFNEDDYPDFVVGSPGANSYYGKIYFFWGKTNLDTIPDIVINGGFNDMFTFGTNITAADFNNDGLSEILIGNLMDPATLENRVMPHDQVYLYSYILPPYKIQYEATNFIYEEPNSFTFDVYVKNNGQYPWQFRNGSLTFTFNSSILRNGSLLWSIVPGFSDFPEQQQPQNTIIYNSYTIGTVETIPLEGITLSPDSRLRYARFRIQTTDSNFAIQPHYLRFVKTGLNKTVSSRWVWYNGDGRLFNNENISFIDLQYELLPVELISFSAILNQNKVQLNWQTETEINNQGFEVQRKIENLDWITICFKPGRGTTTEPTAYLYEDDISEINTNKIYYRLIQIDFNGSVTYSDEVEVITQPFEFSISQNYPNPFNPTTTIKYELPQNTNVKIEVFDILGRLVAALTNEEKNAGRYEVDFNAASLSSGVYYYRIQAGDFVKIKKMMLLR